MATVSCTPDSTLVFVYLELVRYGPLLHGSSGLTIGAQLIILIIAGIGGIYCLPHMILFTAIHKDAC